ncbi:MAG: hypothetical protein RLZZ511_2117 [Cyanobacteriota bacterium]|jgi:formylglycine-generating enzyme required for sulfatase activity/uncharacterized caspase-like protein
MTSEAIVIGVNNYEFLQPLSYAQQDALALKNFLEQEAKFDRVYYFAEDALPVNGVSMKPTRNNLRRVMRDTFAQPFMGDGDNFWFFFSGHGMRDGERDFLMPIDGDPDDVAESGISTAQVSEWLRGCGADNVVMILDACRSGGRKDGKGIGDETREGCRQTGVISLFSCSPNQFSYELPTYGQGAFTKVLLEGLGVQGACATVARLDEYLKRRVPEVVRECLGNGVNQYPYSIAEPINKSHLILMPKHSRPEDLNALKMDAFRAKDRGDLRLAYQCWLRVNIASSGSDMEAIDKIVELRLELSQSIPIAQPKAVPKPEVPISKGDRASAIALPTFKFQYATIDDTLKIQKHDGTAHYFRETINGVDLDLVQIPAGSFDMGSDEYDSEKPIHRVTVPEFFMGKYPVTQAQWRSVAQLKQKNRELKADPSRFKGADRPVEQVSWEDAIEFCDRLSEHTGKYYRLPSEAEWEYACRAGTTTPFHFGATIDASIVNYNATSTYGKGKKGEYRQQTTPVGSFPANAWGLFDCHGNVWEFCADNWHDDYNDAPTDGSAWTTGGDTEYPILRGGSWICNPADVRSSLRVCYFTRAFRLSLVGFRVVLCGFGGSPRTLR